MKNTPTSNTTIATFRSFVIVLVSQFESKYRNIILIAVLIYKRGKLTIIYQYLRFPTYNTSTADDFERIFAKIYENLYRRWYNYWKGEENTVSKVEISKDVCSNIHQKAYMG